LGDMSCIIIVQNIDIISFMEDNMALAENILVTKEFIGKKIREMRLKKGHSQELLAAALGINRVGVSQIESGRRDVSSVELAALSEYFGVPADALLGAGGPDQEISEAETVPADAGERISVPKLKKKKFKEVLLYILEKTAGKQNVGQTVIYKLLYFADFNYYEKYEEHLTGAKYIKNRFGPTPTAFGAILDEMVAAGEASPDCNKYFGKSQTRYVARRRADLRALNGAEKEIIDEVINRLADMNGAQISDYSHDDIPWKVAKEGEAIDYEAVFYRTPQYSVRAYEEL